MGKDAISLSLGISVISLGIFLYKRKNDAVLLKKEAEFRTKVAETELKALRSQMNPHFIFNSLNSINDYISTHKNKSASDYLTKFAKLMRLTLEFSLRKRVNLQQELELLELYLQLENLRLDQKFSHAICIDEEIDQENTLVPPLLLQPFLENCVWHGIPGQKKPCHIKICIRKEKDHLKYLIEDNGVGRTKDNPPVHKKSFGTTLTKDRIEIINQLSNLKGSVKFTDLTPGLRVEMCLPLERRF